MRQLKYFGHYLGIVVQNNDPDKRGRVKVFVPHITPTVYKKWNEVVKDKKFKFVGKNFTSDINEIIDDLKKILPWAEISAPLTSETGSGKYNAFKHIGTISDSSYLETAVSSTTGSQINTQSIDSFSPNLDNIGEKPGNVFDISYYKLKDAFNIPSESNANVANKFSYNYTPECYSNCAKGSFPIPSVGAHVWVFFHNGDPLKPVVFGSSHGSSDWKSIFNIPITNSVNTSAANDPGVDYPGTYENKGAATDQEYDINVDTYRSKYVINQKGGTLAFINTDNREVLKLTHYSGSFKEFNNFTNIELATNNDQKLVLNDQFLTVRGTRNEFTELDYDNITKGDHYRKVGDLNRELHLQWKGIAQEIADTKQLFDIMRTGKVTNEFGQLLTSPLQSMGSSGYDKCPVCNKSTNSYFMVNNTYDEEFSLKSFATTSNSSGNFKWGKTLDPFEGIFPSIDFLGNMGTPEIVTAISDLGGSGDGTSGENRPGMIMGITCPACKGSGISPSSQGGTWDADQKKQGLRDLILAKAEDLARIEKQMGIGGSEIIDITKHKVETIGTVMNDFGSIRVDMKGKMYISDVQVGKYGTFYNRTPSPLVELVHVDDLPGGNYTLNICNRYNVMVGAGGIHLKSYGQVNISGSITNVAGKQVNIGSELETNIDGGKRLSLVADIISLRQRNKNQVVVEGSLGITDNAIIGGGLHVEGDISANSITIPFDMTSSEEHHAYAAAVTDENNENGMIIGFGTALSNYPQGPNGKGKEWKPSVFKASGGPYLGFTDSSTICGRLEVDSKIGYIPNGNVGVIPVGTEIKGTMTHSNPLYSGDVTIITTDVIAVKASQDGASESDVEIKASDSGKSGGNDVPVYGSGPSNDEAEKQNQLEEGGVTECVKGADAGIDGKSAFDMPIVVYGTGRQNDSIYVNKHSHRYKSPRAELTQSNASARKGKIGVQSAVPAQPITHFDK